MLYNSPAFLYNVGKRGDAHEKTNACAAAGSALHRTDGLRQHGHRRKGRNAVRAVRRAARATPEEIRRTAAEQYADGLTLEEQIAQMFFVRCPETDAAALTAQYDIGGYLLFARDFDGQTKESVANTIAAYQNAAKTPMLIGVDEEGGTVVRVSSNPNLRGTKFQSPQALYSEGGFDRITSDTAEKDALLRDLGINVNFAPV
mgnify:CR=1 FL=1